MSQIDKTPAHLHLLFSTDRYTIVRLPADFPVPPSLFTSSSYSFASVTRTPAELSVILATRDEQSNDAFPELQHTDRQVEGPWTTIQVQGPMDLSLTGILHELTTPLRAAAVPIFALSTWDTDYILVPASKADNAAAALREAGWTITNR